MAVSNVTAQVKIRGNVFGGGNEAPVGGSVTVNMTGGTVNGDVYGGGAKANTNTDNWDGSTFSQSYHKVTIKEGESVEGYYTDAAGTTPAAGTAVDEKDYYKKNETIVKLSGGEVKQDIYGGGLGYDDADNTKDKPANVYGDVTVTTTGGKARDVFGANNVLGTPKGVIAVNINGTAEDGVRNVYGGGNQATYEGASTTVTMTAGKAENVYGGGLSADVAGSVTVNIQGGTVTTDVYGGGALGNTNTGNWNSATSTLTPTYSTTVNLTDGTITGNVYGGALGQKAVADNPATTDVDESDDGVAALVYGNVTVNIGAAAVAPSTDPTGNITIGGSVFGCNNANGTPKGDVVVNVYKTHHTTTQTNNQYPSFTTGLNLDDATDALYALKAVYGGGNEAAYVPVAGTSTPHSTTVHVWGCDENTVKAVYGGGNAADVGDGSITANTNVIIDGGRFYTIFGGGNGAGLNNPGANIFGTATTDIKGGLFNQIFGGSNSKGDVEVVALSIDNSTCELMVNESFGGANMSPLTGNVITTLTCSENVFKIGTFYGGSNQASIDGNVTLNVYGGQYNNIFGGSKGVAAAAAHGEPGDQDYTPAVTAVSADITGNVTLNLYGGTIDENAFGGSNINGSIGGKITVNVLNNGGNCALSVAGNIYGAGNVTPYTPTYALGENETERISPVVNVIHGTVANVFGGAKGETATVTASPQVNIGYDATTMGDLETENTLLYSITQDKTNYTSDLTPDNFAAVVTDTVYGGGDLAQVSGDTEVYLRKTNSQVGALFGGGNMADVSGNTTVSILGGTVTHDVYGGGALADVGTGGETPTTHQVLITGGTITENVYGGGLGRIHEAAVDDDPLTTDVDESKPEVIAIAALVNGTVAVKLNENNGTAKVGGSLFGCNNLNGTPKGNVTVDIYGTYDTGSKPTKFADYLAVSDGDLGSHPFELAGVFGGGNLAAYNPTSGSTTVNIHGCGTSSIKEVYGGGNAASVTDCAVNVYGAYEIGYVYGGGKGTKIGIDDATADAAADVTGSATTTINGGTIYRTFGGSNTNGNIGTSTLTIEQGTNTETGCEPKLGDVFSYGNRATMSSPATVTLGCLTNKVGALYGGAMNADINNNITLNVKGGTYSKVFGGNKTGGSINGSITVNIEEESTSCGINIDDLYGCGNEAPYSIYGTEKNSSDQWIVKNENSEPGFPKADPQINLRSFTSIGNVFGAGLGESAVVLGTPTININVIKASGYTLGNVYGGGSMASVTGNTVINIGTAPTVTMATVTEDNPATTEVNEHTPAVLSAAISGDVFGGGYGASTEVSGTATINIGERSGSEGSYVYTDRGASFSNNSNIYGGSALGTVATTQVNLYAGTIAANVFGGGKGRLAEGEPETEGYVAAQGATISTKATVNLCDATVTGNIYGGCNDMGTTAEAELNLLGGSVGTSGVGDMVFGGGKGHATTTNTATVNVGSQTTTGEPPVTTYAGTSSIYSNVYGGSALGAVGTAIVNLNHVTTLTGHVFGGGMGEGTSDDTKATITTSATVNQNGITLAADKDIYGGCNINGTAAATYVYVLGGTVNDVFGGGLGQHTGVTGNVLVEVGHFNGTNAVSGTATVTRNVYGGSAKGAVNSNTSNTTTVNLWKGAINGDVYGGGLGDKASMGEGHADIAAVVNGNVRVNLNGYDDESTPTAMGECVVKGSIFGGNNANGSPAGTAEVHIYKTVGWTDNHGTPEDTSDDISHVRTVTPSTADAATYELTAVYGGGNLAAFNGTTTNVVIETCDPSIKTVYGGGNAADATNTSVLVKGAYEIGTVFGGGNGEVTPANVSGTATTVLNGGRIHDFYGGSNTRGTIGTYNESTHETSGGTNITINDLSISTETGCGLQFDNIYGAGKSANVDGNISMTMGCLSDAFTVQNLYGGAQAADVRGDVTLTVTSGSFTNVFGGNNVTGTIHGNITVNLEETGCKPLTVGNVYGGGNLAPYSGQTTVNLKSFTSVGNVYGGGLGAAAIVTGSTTVNIDQVYGAFTTDSLGVITGNVYGGGSEASVVGSTHVNIGTHSTVTMASLEDDSETPAKENEKTVVGTKILGNVFGGGYGADTNVSENVEVVIGGNTTYVNDSLRISGDVYGGSALGTVNGASADASKHTTVTLNKGKVTGSVYGGGLGDKASLGGSHADHAAMVNGAITVTVNGGKAANVFGCNNVNGSPQSTVAVYVNGTATDVALGTAAIGNVYGGGNQAAYTYRDNAHPLLVEINLAPSATDCIVGNVYGGGLSADVEGSIMVNVKGGRVLNDVYGGGALANTNTANWDGSALSDDGYHKVTGLTAGSSFVKGLYTKSGNTYTLITDKDLKAADGTDYYRLGTTYNTTVNLTGGIVGNAYGGGLGDLAVLNSGDDTSHTDQEANVYGDVSVNVNGTGFTAQNDAYMEYWKFENNDYVKKELDNTAYVPKTGRVFGCNNLNGTPKGNVTVDVRRTRKLNELGTAFIEGHETNKYEIRGVYGGGNMANYNPVTGKKTALDVHNCEETMIEKVYGGGNSASVPETHVTIYGAREIHYVFGGGNGADVVWKNGRWQENDGANVTGNANVVLKGGNISDAFIGSDTKGSVANPSANVISDTGGDCKLKLTNFYGSSKRADVFGDVNVKISTCSKDDIENVYAGSYDAQIHGNITMTVTSGILKNVYGGNDRLGSIGGNIFLNIEEADECRPIIIQNLYGGGFNAPYPGEGATKLKAGGNPNNHDDYDDPVTSGKITINVKSCTRIDNIFGGGFGENAVVTGETEINVNMKNGTWAGQNLPDLTGYPGQTPPNIENVGGVNKIKNEIGTIGNIYGGGNQGAVAGIATINIGTESEIQHLVYAPSDPARDEDDYIRKSFPVLGAHITGNVYGGGNLADVTKEVMGKDAQNKPIYRAGTGRTYVNICAKETSGVYKAVSNGTVTIEGNVYGGGRGLADNFFCRQGMVGLENENDGSPRDDEGTTVRIGNGTIENNVYGGGEVGRVEWNSHVTIGLTPASDGLESAPVIKGSVFGGGKGVSTHGYSALLRGDTHVTVQANAKVKECVYGGGEIASVGRYNVATAANAATYGVEPGMPYSLFDARTGQCHVTVQGNAVIGPDAAMTMPTFLGNVFGGGKGVLPYEGYAANEDPWRMPPDNTQQYYARSTQKAAYLKYVETLALATRTYVTIDGNAFVKGSVYGGSEEGIVQQNTLVKIKGGQIGCGKNTTDRHPSTVWDIVTPADNNPDYECASWPYEAPYDTYDMYAGTTGYDSKDGATTGKDGHTYYGNVFGGGCGKDPYQAGEWHTRAGAVGGNTRIEITGGHILTNVYGGNELTNVGTDGVDTTGVCIITMSGGTLGVPRTLDQIKNHPVTCYLFGGGKGDQRVLFNKETNVRDVVVSVTGGTIYGSVFGGGEDGHVMRDVTMTIGNTDGTGPKIGTWGTSYVDGNVFGGGRGFAGDAYTAGNVAGSIDLTIKGGTMLGSIYGGGRLGSVGYGLYDATTNSSPTPGYGEMRDDDKLDNGTTTTFYNSRIANWHNLGRGRGHVNVNISGGTIGNDYEFEFITPETTIDDTYRSTHYVPYTLFDTDNRLLRTKGGNVFAGGMGRRTKLDGTTPISLTDDGIDWHKLGNVKSTKLTISGTPWIKGSVYGGGEFGAVTGSRAVLEESTPVLDAENNAISAGTEIVISGGTIGTMMQQGVAANTVTSTTTGSGDNRYTFGSVYGGGYGTEDDATPLVTDVETFGAYVNSNTYINMTAGAVRASVYGGGEMACVKGNTYVNVGGGTIGVGEVRVTAGDKQDYVLFGGYRMGNVYGGGKGSTNAVYSGLVKGNTYVNISAGAGSGEPFIYHNVYGGGAYGSVGTFTPTTSVPSAWTSGGKATVTVTGGTIGINGWDNGMVNGSGRGDVSAAAGSDPYDKLAWVHDTEVTIGTSGAGPAIKGSVYGGGENGHNFADATVNVLGGTIGVASDDATWGSLDIKTRGNVFGAGCGTDTYDVTVGVNTYKRHNAMAGIVRGNTTVHVSGGQVYNSVYGGGSMGSVGTITNFFDLDTQANGSYLYKHCKESTDGKGTLYDFGLSWPYEFTYAENTGLATVTVDVTAVVDGWVFGSAKGTVDDGVSDISQQRYAEAKLANVRATLVTIGTSGGSAAAPTINQSVYGGGEDGHVYEDASVTIHHGTITHSVFGGGKGDGKFTTTLRVAKGGDNSTEYDELPEQNVNSWTAGRVYGNSTVTMNGGTVGWFIYGGGNLGSVGKGNYSGGSDDYSTGGYGEMPPQANQKLWSNTDFTGSGTATVNLFGGTVGNGSGTDDDGIPHGSVFGGSRGKAAASCKRSPRYKYVPDFFLGYVNNAIINIGGTMTNDVITEATGDSPEIYGSVYGGGQDGHVRNSTEVRIFKGKIKGHTSDASGRSGNVFGAGSGIGTYIDGGIKKVNNSSGSVTCTTLVEVYGDDDKGESTNKTVIKGNVYGGGALASVGPPKTPAQASDEQKDTTSTVKSHSHTRVNFKGGYIGGSIFGASRGPGDSYLTTEPIPVFDTTDRGVGHPAGSYDETKYATDIWSYAYVSGGRIAGNVYGGGEGGIVKRDTEVHLTGGTIGSDTGGGDAYGGGKGTANIAADVGGNTLVELNNNVDPSETGCIVKRIFGCNDFKGTPKGHVKVHVYATQNANTTSKPHINTKFNRRPANKDKEKKTLDDYKAYLQTVIDATKSGESYVDSRITGSVITSAQDTHNNGSATEEQLTEAINNVLEELCKLYDVEAVYGGGNLAMYEPYETNEYTEVIIDGCNYTSIRQVYGGGNAASTPATSVTVNETYEIDELFGGGNGKDNYQHPIDGKWYQNLGANVGYKSTSTHPKGAGQGTGEEGNPYQAVDQTYDPEPTVSRGKRMDPDNHYIYGAGTTITKIFGGTVHTAYGGSNEKGYVRTSATSQYESKNECDLNINETYGAGKNAPVDGDVNLNMNCAKGIEEIFGGSKESDVNADIHLKITNGSSLKRVFGGNNTSGNVNGSITVEIEENGCEPIHIQNLYAGGYLAPYSVYGYKSRGVVNKAEDGDRLYNDPVINVISASRIDNIFGGGYQATVVGNPHVNVNMKKGLVDASFVAAHADFVGEHTEDGVLLYKGLDTNGTLEVGTIGTIYGGGNQADIWGNTYVDIGTGEWLNLSRQREMLGTYSDETTTITTPTTFTYKKLNEEDPSEQWTYVDNADPDNPVTRGLGANRPTPTRHAATITGNVFGGGKGLEDEFYCKKGMVGEDGKGANADFSDNVDYKDGNTNVTIAHGTVRGNVYGGGEVGRVEKNSMVTIGKEDGTGSPEILGDVFGGGKGKETHGYSALLRGNPTVIIQGTAKVRGSVYGGGEIASVARYKVVNGTPVALANNTSGFCKVIVRGHAEIGPDNMQMKKEDGEGNPLPPDDKGHVFGAGKGVLPNVYDYKTKAVYEAEEHTEPYDPDKHRPKRMLAAVMPLMDNESSTWEYSDAPHENKWEYFGSDAIYHSFIETLALSSNTDVTISDNAFIKGSVYGGSENGIVQYDTHVTIKDNCQIGCGKGKTEPYSEELWTQALAADDYAKLAAIEALMPECAHWDYVNTSAAPYDPFAKYKLTVDGKDKYYYDEDHKKYAEGGSNIAKDGHSYYGNVFGGGSGVIPYAPGLWHRATGQVRGNTVVDITGGHILTCVYGGNEHTDVGTYTKDATNNNDPIIPESGGKCTVNMVGGTVGVPRTPSQISAFPFPGYLFGSGKGDQRIFFNTWTNVTNTEVNITGNARIFGSVLGGGEDGHVINDAKTTIGGSVSIDLNGDGDKTDEGETFTAAGLIIGTTGTSYADGHVFGAGRGFSGEALTAGSVGGNVEVNIKGGSILGSVYGGGRLASVGTPFTSVNSTQYGTFIEDDPETTDVDESLAHGHVTVNITGGTIGNDYEDIYLDGADKTTADGWTEEEWNTWKANNCVPYTEFELSEDVYRATHTKGGNVFGGSMGRLTLLDGSLAPKWTQLGQAKSATVNISGNSTVIKSCVYGGSELGTIRDNTTVVIGKKSKTDTDEPTRPTIMRDLYGGGYGSVDDTKVGYIETTDDEDNTIVFRFTPMQWAGCVGKSSEIDIYNGWVKRNVYGGGEMASVGIFNYEIRKVATEDVSKLTEADVTDTDYKTGDTWKYQYIKKHHDEANGFALSWPYEVEYVPGGYVGDTYINIYGGRLGVDDDYNIWKDNGDIYGGSKGIAGDRYKMAFCGNVGSSHINIEYPSTNTANFSNYLTKRETSVGSGVYVYDHDCIVGAVYGGGEDGHVMGDTHVTLKNGLIGHAMYGGGSGKGKYNERRLKIGAKPIDDTLPKENWTYAEEDKVDANIYSITAGKVYGNTHVKMEGGYVGRFVYGGGNMGSVGKGNYAGATDDYSYYGTYNGYGEHLHDDADDSKDEKLWTHSEDFNPNEPISADNLPVTMADHFLSSGKTEVEIFGGKIGYVKADPTKSIKDGLPYGSVFGGSRGESAPNIGESPRYLYSPEFFSGYVNETKVTIGDPDKMSDKSYTGPTIIGSVFGGGQDGHVRRDTHVIVNAGEIGLPYDEESTAKTNVTMVGTSDTDNPQWLHRGNVYGAGSGIGKYKFDFSNDGNIDETGAEIDYKNPQTGRTSKVKEIDFSTSAGSVTRFTKVEVKGGLIHRNVYGGGSMSSVGPPKIPPTRPDGDGYIKDDELDGHGPGKQTLNEVIVGGVSGVKAQIGTPDGFTTGLKYNPNYGGYVFGASRGDLSLGESYGTSVWTRVKILKGASIRGNVFGGGDNGLVKQDTDVIIGEKKE
jgi:hypothetical protein